MAANPISPREKAQQEILDFLNAHEDKFTAPYGILSGLQDLPNGGKVRTITFGVARHLDATINVWSPTRIQIEAQGAYASHIAGDWNSVEQVIKMLAAVFDLDVNIRTPDA